MSWGLFAGAIVFTLVVGLFVYRSVVAAVGGIIEESLKDVLNKMKEIGDVTADLDKRLRKVEALVIKDMITGGRVYESNVDDEAGELADLIPSLGEEEEDNVDERTGGDSDTPQ